MPAWIVPAAFAAVFAASLALTGLVTGLLRRRQVLDRPNERSSHLVPTPRGGGWGLLPPLLLAWAAVAWASDDWSGVWPVVAAAVPLALISWADDLSPVPPGWRLVAQALAVTVAMIALPVDTRVFQGWLPLAADRALAGLLLLWFVNLYNFMDGIDGITGTETLCLGLGLAAAGWMAGSESADTAYALALAGAALGFLAWNWYPARVFLGDVGSVPLGFLSGWLLLRAAADGLWLPALVLPLYYLADATLTLLRRLARGERVWEAHRQHFYQQAVRHIGRHDQVVMAVLAGNAGLAALALAALSQPLWALAAPLLVAGLLAWMATSLGR
ncbi:MAG TPA: glycosyltransferase family 4 protein [Azospirillaceae bacterium]|nr:glycosyltransferase family 4 protein [Azospirillaceae bacterium]